MSLAPKTCVCPCGEVLPVPVVANPSPLSMPDHEFQYDPFDIECPKCHRRSTGGNFRTGEVSSWITARAAAKSEAIYERMQFEADMNEWYGRGEW